MDDYFNYAPNPRMSKSASETLDNYMKDYDKSGNGLGSCSIGSRSTRKDYFGASTNSLQKDVSALDREILLARKLFPQERLNWSLNDSLTTEELLMEQPFDASFCSSSSESIHQRGCYLRVSELGANSPCRDSRPSDSGIRRSSVAHSDLHHDLKTFQELIDRENIVSPSQLVRSSTSYTPVAQLGRSKISSDNLEGELKVSMNCARENQSLPRSQFCEQLNLDNPIDSRVCNYDRRRDGLAQEDRYVSVALQLEGKPASVREFMGKCFSESADSRENTSSAERSAERTVESLKNMLFSLQELSSDTKSKSSEHSDVDQGYESLEKAMQHLAILKSLVKEASGTANANRC